MFLELISNLGHRVSANDDVIKNCEIFIQTVFNQGTSKETYVETRVRLYKKQKPKNSVSSPSDPLSCKQQTSCLSREILIALLAALYR